MDPPTEPPVTFEILREQLLNPKTSDALGDFIALVRRADPQVLVELDPQTGINALLLTAVKSHCQYELSFLVKVIPSSAVSIEFLRLAILETERNDDGWLFQHLLDRADPLCLLELDPRTGANALLQTAMNTAHVPYTIVRCILKCCPAIATVVDNAGRVPLHYAVEMAVPQLDWEKNEKFLKRLMHKNFEKTFGLRDRDGRLPIHRAIMVHRFTEASDLLDRQRSCDIDTTCPTEGSLLHLALKYDATDDFVVDVIKCVPACVTTPDPDGDYALHAAVDYRASMYQIEMILSANPSACAIPGDKGYLPHHLEAAISGRLEVLQLLFEKHPDGFTQHNHEGSLPIHVALRNAAIDRECLQFLHEKVPSGLVKVDCHGFAAFHMACIPRKSAQVSPSSIRWLLETCPALIRSATDTGLLPLHVLAQSSHAEVEALTMLLLTFPRALQTGDADGDLPLHTAVHRKQEAGPVVLENAACLVQAYPEGMRCENMHGQLPLHIACANPAVTLDVIDWLCEEYPGALMHYDKFGLLPIHYACTVEIVDQLIPKLDGSSEIVPSSQGNVPALFVACEQDARLEVILRLVECSKHLF